MPAFFECYEFEFGLWDRRSMSSPATRNSLLIRICNPRDAVAWEEFVAIYRPILIRVAAARGLQAEDAQEIAQEVLMAVMKSISKFEAGSRVGSFRRWLATITSNKIHDHLRHRRREIAIREIDVAILASLSDQSIDAIDDALDRHWKHQLFILALDVVRPTVQRVTWDAFWKTTMDQLPAERVAKETGLSLGSVYVARSRILSKLRHWVERQSQLGMENLP